MLLLCSSCSQGEITVAQPRDVDGLLPQMRAHIEQCVGRARAQPEDPERHGQLGLAYAANGLWAEARESFHNVVLLDADHMLGRYHWILALQRVGEPEAALAELERFMSAHPSFAPGRQRLGLAQLDAGQLEAARTSFTLLAQMSSGSFLAHQGLGAAHYRLADFPAAKTALEKSFSINTNSAQTRYLLGMALRELGQLQRAEELLASTNQAYQEFISDDWSRQFPAHSRDLGEMVRRAQLMASQGRYEESASLMRGALEWQPKNVDLLNNLSGVLRSLNKIGESRQLLEQALALDGKRFETQMNLAMVEGLEGNLTAGLARIDYAIELAPDVAFVHFSKGDLLRSAQRLSEARTSFRAAIAINPTMIEAHIGVISTSADMNQWEAAEAALKEAQRIAPQHPVLVSIAQQIAARGGGGG